MGGADTRARQLRLAVIVTLALVAVLLLTDPGMAQAPRGPFGLGERPAAPPSGFVGWMLFKQAEFHRGLIAALSQARSGGGAWLLITSGFLYGVFHAAGPGHGKAVVASYVLANGQALRRGVAISFVAALIQALIAILLVGIAVTLLQATARRIDGMVRAIEIISFGLIAAFGLLLTIRKARALYALWSSPAGAAADPACEDCSRFRLSYRPKGATATATAVDGPACGHVVMPDAAAISGNRSFAELATIAFVAGSRPCTGAILILVLAFSAGIVPVGIAAVMAMALGTALATSGFALAAGGARSLAGGLASRSERLRPLIALIELLAAIVVMLLGVALLLGYLSGA